MELLLLLLFLWLLSRGRLQQHIDRAFPPEPPVRDVGPDVFRPVGPERATGADDAAPCWICGGPKDGHAH